MCGIVGYVGDAQCAPILLDGLKRLEYRGYDSAGTAIYDGEGLDVRRAVGKLRNLEKALATKPPEGTLGIGHTRWATHGRPSEENAHPHVVGRHRRRAQRHHREPSIAARHARGARDRRSLSDTDTEVLAHLIRTCQFKLRRRPGSSPRRAQGPWPQVAGAYAIAVLFASSSPTSSSWRRTPPPSWSAVGDGETVVRERHPRAARPTPAT